MFKRAEISPKNNRIEIPWYYAHLHIVSKILAFNKFLEAVKD